MNQFIVAFVNNNADLDYAMFNDVEDAKDFIYNNGLPTMLINGTVVEDNTGEELE